MTNLSEKIHWEKTDGLIPAIVQNAETQQVLMLGYMNEEALSQTLSSGKVTFYSRSKKRIWQKGESSQNFLHVVKITLDCDGDTLLIAAQPAGPTCHLGTTSCFGSAHAPGIGFLAHLEQIIAKRRAEMTEGSYTVQLFQAGIDRIAQKVGEEAVETIIAAKNPQREDLLNEVSDLIYHLLVLLRQKDTDLGEVVELLRQRHMGS